MPDEIHMDIPTDLRLKIWQLEYIKGRKVVPMKFLIDPDTMTAKMIQPLE